MRRGLEVAAVGVVEVGGGSWGGELAMIKWVFTVCSGCALDVQQLKMFDCLSTPQALVKACFG